MRIKIQKVDASTMRNQTIMRKNVDAEMLVDDLRASISESLSIPKPLFYLFTWIKKTKVMMTDSWPLSFFQSGSYLKVQIELFHVREYNMSRSHTVYATESEIEKLKLSLFQKAVSMCSRNATSELVSLLDLQTHAILNEVMNTVDDKGWSLLHFMCLYGCSDLLEKYLSLFKNLNQETADGWTPLQITSYHGFDSSVVILIQDPSIQINKMTTKRGSPLHLSCENGNIAIVTHLLESRAACFLEDPFQKIPLEYATKQEIFELIPTYVGKWELEKYQNSPPAPFVGQLWKSEKLKLKDKKIHAEIQASAGVFEIKLPSNQQSIRFPLANINKVAPISGFSLSLKTFYFFEIRFTKSSKRFYTKKKEDRDRWVSELREAISYCQLNKIDAQEVNEYEVDEEEILEAEHQSIEGVNLKSFEWLEALGEGSYGTVYKVKLIESNEIYAMKVLNMQFLKKNRQLKYAISECKIMKQLEHPFVLTLYYAFKTTAQLYMVIEYCPLGDLERLLDEEVQDERIIRFYIAEILLALEYLHSLDIMYRDLKPANVLLDSRGHVRLADFGLAKAGVEDVDMDATLVGSPIYISPEILRKQDVTKSADLYSLGVMMYELLTGEPPFNSDNLEELFKHIKNGKFSIPASVSPDARNLIKKLLNSSPSKRPSIPEIKADPFFKNIDWDMLLAKRYKPPVAFAMKQGKGLERLMTGEIEEII